MRAWLGTVAFGMEIYLDFSGYSEMALGLARMFGVVLPLNFMFPYISRNPSEFWRRWHITLSPGCATISTCRWVEIAGTFQYASQSDDDDAVGRFVAWCELDFRVLGFPARRTADPESGCSITPCGYWIFAKVTSLTG